MTATNDEILYLLATINAGDMFEPVPRCGVCLRVAGAEGLIVMPWSGGDAAPTVEITSKGKARLEAGLS